MRGKNTPQRKVASTGDRTCNHQVMSLTCSPLSHMGGAYLLVGKVGGTKNEMEVQEFKTPASISSFVKMKHYSAFWGQRASGIDGEHASVFSPDVLSDGLSLSFDTFLEKALILAVSSPFQIHDVLMLFSPKA